MAADLDELRQRIRAYGVADVARAANVPATTLYSFCQNPDRELSYGAVMAVARAFAIMDAGDRRVLAVERGFEPAGMIGVSVVSQSSWAEAEGYPGHNVDPRRQRRWFDAEWLESIAPKHSQDFAMVRVTERELAPLLKPGDLVLLNRAKLFTESPQPGIFLVRSGGSVKFLLCKRSSDNGSKPAYIYKASSKPNAQTITVVPSQIVGFAFEVARSLTVTTEFAAGLGAQKDRSRATQRTALKRGRRPGS